MHPRTQARVLILEAFPAFLPSSFGMSDRAASARERNGFEECAEVEDAGITLDLCQPTLAPLCKGGKDDYFLSPTQRRADGAGWVASTHPGPRLQGGGK